METSRQSDVGTSVAQGSRPVKGGSWLLSSCLLLIVDTIEASTGPDSRNPGLVTENLEFIYLSDIYSKKSTESKKDSVDCAILRNLNQI